MFERYQTGDRAILAHVSFGNKKTNDDLPEFKMLVSGAGVEILSIITAHRNTPDPRYGLGSGKMQEIAQEITRQKANVVIVNFALSPTQERNLEKYLCTRVVDRTSLILDIFSQRARSHEGKLQVELAQLKHLSTRLIRGWTHLERQRGGIGLRGPGETQLETDRRLLKQRMKTLLARLDKVANQRENSRYTRLKNNTPTVALVGYTNAGKSTLFNQLTQADVYAADQLFATLDPTLRQMDVPDFGTVVLADTVGFIRDLPHDLIAAFKATLKEIVDADLILHLVDATDKNVQDNIEQVQQVLLEIGAQHQPQLIAFNKMDCLVDFSPLTLMMPSSASKRVHVSAKTGQGMLELQQAIRSALNKRMVKKRLTLPPEAARLRGIFYQINSVQKEDIGAQGEFILDVYLPAIEWHRLMKQEQLCLSWLH